MKTKAERAETQRKYREKHPTYKADNIARVQARYKALVRLSEKHPEEFQKLLDEERQSRGLTKKGTQKPGRKVMPLTWPLVDRPESEAE